MSQRRLTNVVTANALFVLHLQLLPSTKERTRNRDGRLALLDRITSVHPTAVEPCAAIQRLDPDPCVLHIVEAAKAEIKEGGKENGIDKMKMKDMKREMKEMKREMKEMKRDMKRDMKNDFIKEPLKKDLKESLIEATTMKFESKETSHTSIKHAENQPLTGNTLDNPDLSLRIFLAYHTNNKRVMITLANEHLKTMDSRAVAYVIAHYALNYQHNHAVQFLREAVTTKSLDTIVIETAVQQLVEHDALFEKVREAIEIWAKEGLIFSPRVLATTLHHYHQYALAAEIQSLMELIRKCGHADHYLVAAEELQHQIAALDLDIHNYKDLLVRVKLCTRNPRELIGFYQSFIAFFAATPGRTLTDMEHILRLFELDGLRLKDNPHLFADILKFVVRHTNSVRHVIDLLEKRKLGFLELLLSTVYMSVVRMHPFNAVRFDRAFKAWLALLSLSAEAKVRLADSLRIRRVASQMVPYNLVDDPIMLKTTKYTGRWSTMQFARNDEGRVCRDREQMAFRTLLGFGSLIEQGVAPDAQVLFETYRRACKTDKTALLQLFKRLRYYEQYRHRLELVDLQEKHSRTRLAHYIGNPGLDLSNGDKLKLARMLMNKNMHHEAARILTQVDERGLSNAGRQFRFQLQLRNCDVANDYATFNTLVAEWDLGQVMVTPYLSKQLSYIMGRLRKKHASLCEKVTLMRKHINGEEVEGYDKIGVLEKRLEEIERAIENLDALIGNVNHRVLEGEHEYERCEERVVEFLKRWVE